MLYKQAKKLHNDDEVTLKKTKEIVTIINSEIEDKEVYIYTMTENGYSKLNHKEIM